MFADRKEPALRDVVVRRETGDDAAQGAADRVRQVQQVPAKPGVPGRHAVRLVQLHAAGVLGRRVSAGGAQLPDNGRGHATQPGHVRVQHAHRVPAQAGVHAPRRPHVRPVRRVHRGRHHRRHALRGRRVRADAHRQAGGHVRGRRDVRAAGRHGAQEVPHAHRAGQRDQPGVRRRTVRVQKGVSFYLFFFFFFFLPMCSPCRRLIIYLKSLPLVTRSRHPYYGCTNHSKTCLK